MNQLTFQKRLHQVPAFNPIVLNPDQANVPLRIQNRTVATWICKLIPTQCPFARQINLFGLSFRIPPLCKLNPFYDHLMLLRFQAQCFLLES
ncbi:MAG: Mo-dependent nitrogenase [Synechococcaceae cyanobacterium SM2_3_1]|nr:Mo-dependent nitrogenase [Synechococcaceae cyanobacterium SM2_3_1]